MLEQIGRSKLFSADPPTPTDRRCSLAHQKRLWLTQNLGWHIRLAISLRGMKSCRPIRSVTRIVGRRFAGAAGASKAIKIVYRRSRELSCSVGAGNGKLFEDEELALRPPHWAASFHRSGLSPANPLVAAWPPQPLTSLTAQGLHSRDCNQAL